MHSPLDETSTDMPLFDEYIKDCNPSQKEKSYAWKTAIGLKDVDGLKPSDYLVRTAGQNIEGDITINEAKQLVDIYYKSASNRHDVENDRIEEADKESARIAFGEKNSTENPNYIERCLNLDDGIIVNYPKFGDVLAKIK